MQRPNGVPACASCKHQRKKCSDKCILAPFFPVEKNKEFQAVHKIFGVSNVGKNLKSHNTEEERKRAADSLIWEAFSWQRDPIQGPYGEYRRVVEELKFYKAQYQKFANSQLAPSTSQGYKSSPVLMNGSYNTSISNNNASINGGISTLMNSISTTHGGLNGNGVNGNSMINDHSSSNPFGYGANANHNHLVVQAMEHQNGNSAAVNNVLPHIQHIPNGNTNQNGSAAVILAHQHHQIPAGFNQQYYLATGQYNNSSPDVNGKAGESSPWQGN